MESNTLSKKIQELRMPKEMHDRIIKNCYSKMEENTMNKNRTNNFFKKTIAVAASFVLCLCLTGVTALAATGNLQGFFKDITRWDGAVTGTSYEQATDEIKLSVVAVSDELTVMAEMVNPSAAPYTTFDTFGIKRYEIVDMNGNVIMEENMTELSEIVEGKVTIVVPVNGLASGNYKLVVSEFVGNAKADQPLIISGNWECEFVR